MPETGLWNLPRKNGKIPNISMERFDAEFFQIPSGDVNFIDPQERLIMEATYEALVDAGQSVIYIDRMNKP